MHGLVAEERKHDFMRLGPDRFWRRNDKNTRRNNLAHGPEREMFLEKTLLITELIRKLIVRRDHTLAPGQIQLKNRSIRVRQTHEAGHPGFFFHVVNGWFYWRLRHRLECFSR